ncbi:MAG: hypothetical protein HYU88_02210 [Chloroflexi bacterium]|nr:hypothetical protein [Chloroflexota bacterium]
MTFNPLDFLTVAENLHQNGKLEAEFHTLVGRAYYALFLVARDRLFPSAVPPRSIRRRAARGRAKDIPIHKAVLDEVSRRNSAVGGKFERLHVLRITADYYRQPQDTTMLDWRANAQEALLISRNIVKRICSI